MTLSRAYTRTFSAVLDGTTSWACGSRSREVNTYVPADRTSLPRENTVTAPYCPGASVRVASGLTTIAAPPLNVCVIVGNAGRTGVAVDTDPMWSLLPRVRPAFVLM